jgi:hypothetical protein
MCRADIGKLRRLLGISDEEARDAAWIMLDLELAAAWVLERYEDEKQIAFQDRWLSAFADPKDGGKAKSGGYTKVGDTYVDNEDLV